MRILKKFKEISLSKQLQVLFTVSASILIFFLILVSYYLIYWLKSKLTEDITVLVSQVQEDQLIRLMELNSGLISTEFSYYLSLSVYLGNLHTEICEGKFPLSAGEGTFDVTEAKKSDKGSFFTKDILSTEGQDLVHNESSLDQVFPFLKSSNLLQIYLGFEVDYLFHSYPPTQMPVGYNPSIREWYYTAKSSYKRGVFTEPYIDASSRMWVISTSYGIYCYDNFVGVAATDITLKSLRNRLSEASLLNGGFFMLVSASGIVVTMPPTWNGETVRLNDTELTGFSSELWELTINPNTSLNHKYKFEDQNSDYLTCFRSLIMPSGQTKVTHYLFSCSVEYTEVIFSKEPAEVFEKTNSYIFWIVFGVAFGVFILTVGIIFWISRKISSEFDLLINAIFGICAKSVFPDTLSYSKYSLSDCKNQLFGLGLKGIEKIERLKNKENEFIGYTWGVTRPNDKYLFNVWETRRYPRNYKSSVQIKWRNLFEELIKRTLQYESFD